MMNIKSALSKRAAVIVSLSALFGATLATVGGSSPATVSAAAGDVGVSITDGVTAVERGTNTTYTITVTNNDTVAPAPAVAVSDVLPTGLTGGTWTCVASAGSTCAAGPVTGDIVDTINLDISGTATYTLTGTVTEPGTTLLNTATVVFAGDTDASNDTAPDTDSVYNSVDLSIVKTDGQVIAAAGQPISYSIVASNLDLIDTVIGARVTDTMPTDLIGATWTCASSAGSNCTTTSGPGNIDVLVDLAPLGTATFTVTGTVSATATGNLANSATIAVPAAGVVDPNLANNSSIATIALPTIHLCAKAGSTTIANGTLSGAAVNVPVWGYIPGNCGTGTVTQPGGPVVTVNVGDVVHIVLHNALPEASALLFQGQAMPPDLVGAAAATGTQSYTFTATNPGTFLYEAGLTANGQHQVGMGLYGALIVRPTTAGQAYNTASTAFQAEGVVVLGEIDTALNNLANPATFDMRNFKAKYSTINGKAYADTAPVVAAFGDKVLLRYVNAGISYHSMGLLGGSQRVIAYDGNPLTYSHTLVAETIGPGQTLDAIVDTAGVAAGSKLAVYDTNLLLNNSNANKFGGMLTFINVAGGGTTGDTTGPATSGVSATPNPTNGSLDVVVTAATIADAAGNVANAEYFVDTTGANGNGTAMTATFGTPSVTGATATIPAATVALLSSGNHTIYVHGLDDATVPNWGSFNFVTLNVDKTGPVVSGPALTPNPTTGAAVAIHATGSDATTGGQNVTAAEYTIDGGAAVAMAVNVASSTVSLDATISAATIGGLVGPTHAVAIRAMDSLGNWGSPVSITLTKQVAGPVMTASPTTLYSNGVIGFSSTTLAVRVTGTVIDSGSSVITGAEGFIDSATPTNGTGFAFFPTDGAWNQTSEAVYADIPLTTVNALAAGNHILHLHGKNALGLWGPATTNVTLVVDKTVPVVLNPLTASITPASPAASTSVALAAAGTDNVGVSRAEWFTGTDPGRGAATAMVLGGTPTAYTAAATINVSTWASGNYTLSVRARDLAQNWSAIRTIQVTVIRGSLYFSTLGASNPPTVGGTADAADIFRWLGTFTRTVDVSTIANPVPAGSNVDGLDRVSATQFYVSFAADTTLPGLGLVQDEDIVFYNAGTWSVYFDGTAHGLTSATAATAANLDIDEFSVAANGDIYFSTLGNSNPLNGVTPVTGTADDADIYKYDPIANVITRFWDATVNGLNGAANVDGLAMIDGTHFYLSFSAANTAVTPTLTVQDEDVVYYNGSTWSVYFDGTSLGLTNNNQDLDAIDVP
jgi:uncharacterized repeat protein (TIGR01451 family)